MDVLFFKLVTTPERETLLLTSLEICTDKAITLYHLSLFGGHQDVIKTYLTPEDKFFILGLIHQLGFHMKGCHICQLSRNKKAPVRQI